MLQNLRLSESNFLHWIAGEQTEGVLVFRPVFSLVKVRGFNLHGVVPLICCLRYLQHSALRRWLEQEPSTPSAYGDNKMDGRANQFSVSDLQ